MQEKKNTLGICYTRKVAPSCTREQIRAWLEAALDEQPAPSLNEIARRLGYSTAARLYEADRHLCWRITTRYRESGRGNWWRSGGAKSICEPSLGQCFQRHRHQEFLRFLRRLDKEFPGKTPLHLVMDNYGTHKHPNVKTWMKKHPRFVPYFVPTSSSWLNLVERWFGELTSKRVRRGSFGSVQELQKAILDFLENWNEKPKPFVWTATVESIQQKLARCRQTLEQIQPGCTLPRSRKRKKQMSS